MLLRMVLSNQQKLKSSDNLGCGVNGEILNAATTSGSIPTRITQHPMPQPIS